jgi:membrane fusion protein (multidrug efflux system)
MNKRDLLLFFLMILVFNFYLIQCSKGNAGNENHDSGDSSKVATDSTKEDIDHHKGQIETEKNKNEEAVPVEVTTVKRGKISDYILLSTNLETEEMADVYPRVQGIVEYIYKEEGNHVEKNMVLLKLEAAEYVLVEERARLNYSKQKANFDRLESMFEENLISKEEYDQARYTTGALEVELKQAELNLSYTKIKAPIRGVIGDRFCKVGDRIQPSDKLFTIINTDEMIAVVYVPEKELGKVAKGQSAFITSDHMKEEKFTGKIKRVSPMVDAQSGTFKVTIAVNNKQNKLRAGMFVNAHIITSTHENTILIPKTAIVYENELMNVFVVKDSLAHKIVLRIGFQDHEKVEVLSGIEEGDKVIVVGQAGLKDKTIVKIVSERENSLAFRKEQAFNQRM